MKKIKVSENDVNKRLDVMLESSFNETRSHFKKLIEEYKIMVNGKVVKAGYLLKINDKITIDDTLSPSKIQAEDMTLDIIYEDKDLLVINKPQGMVVHPGAGNYSGTLVNGLLKSVKDLSGINGELRPGIVHRLDKDTSGLLLIAKNDTAHVSLARQIEEKSCVRKYLALVEGLLKEETGHIETFIGRHPKDRKKMAVLPKGKKAITNYRVIKYYKKYTLVEFKLETGRTHQIRVHAKYMNHPVVGDKTYGHEVKGLSGQLLHSCYIEFTHPTKNERMKFESNLPDYFNNFLKKLN